MLAELESPLEWQLIELRFFNGLTAKESAEALSLSVDVVRHELRFCEAGLQGKLTGWSRNAQRLPITSPTRHE